MTTKKLTELNWTAVNESLLDSGYSILPQILSRDECRNLAALYNQPDLFRSRIDMTKYRFGKGEYQYFRYPLPPRVQELREIFYPNLLPAANQWSETCGTGTPFPAQLTEFLERCHSASQTRPTPLILHYREGDFNCLHQDIYGEVAFAFQVVLFLSEPEQDYSGGEFLLVEQAPRAQAMGRAFRLPRGSGLVFCTRYRPSQGKRSVYKVTMRHGLSPLTSGERWALGIIFHDSK
jgi:hypothetical protein